MRKTGSGTTENTPLPPLPHPFPYNSYEGPGPSRGLRAEKVELKARQPVPRPLLAELRCAPAASPAACPRGGARGSGKKEAAGGSGGGGGPLPLGLRDPELVGAQRAARVPREPMWIRGWETPRRSRRGPDAKGWGWRFPRPISSLLWAILHLGSNPPPPPQLQSPLSRLPSAVRK